MSSDIERVGGWLAAAERVTVLTGAGISTDSGIPDFRGPQGVWTKNPGAEKSSTLQNYVADPEVRRDGVAGAGRCGAVVGPTQRRAPGDRRHRARRKAARVVTQNIDELHQKAGNDPALVIEVHGTAWWTRCLSCGDRRPMAETLDRVRDGEDDPPCLVCGGILKSDTISFGQALVPRSSTGRLPRADHVMSWSRSGRR